MVRSHVLQEETQTPEAPNQVFSGIVKPPRPQRRTFIFLATWFLKLVFPLVPKIPFKVFFPLLCFSFQKFWPRGHSGICDLLLCLVVAGTRESLQKGDTLLPRGWRKRFHGLSHYMRLPFISAKSWSWKTPGSTFSSTVLSSSTSNLAGSVVCLGRGLQGMPGGRSDHS